MDGQRVHVSHHPSILLGSKVKQHSRHSIFSHRPLLLWEELRGVFGDREFGGYIIYLSEVEWNAFLLASALPPRIKNYRPWRCRPYTNTRDLKEAFLKSKSGLFIAYSWRDTSNSWSTISLWRSLNRTAWILGGQTYLRCQSQKRLPPNYLSINIMSGWANEQLQQFINQNEAKCWRVFLQNYHLQWDRVTSS